VTILSKWKEDFYTFLTFCSVLKVEVLNLKKKLKSHNNNFDMAPLPNNDCKSYLEEKTVPAQDQCECWGTWSLGSPCSCKAGLQACQVSGINGKFDSKTNNATRQNRK